MQLVRWCVERELQHVFNVDEKWIEDVVEHYRTLAKLCKDFPPDAIAYDLLNEPFDRLQFPRLRVSADVAIPERAG
jgi:hypothetical protein